jgi:hypothetical protein
MSKIVIAGVSLVVILTVLGVGLNLFGKAINVLHWWDIGFQMVSYHPWIPFIGLAGVVAYLAVAYITDAHIFFWLVGLSALVYDIILLYGIYFV